MSPPVSPPAPLAPRRRLPGEPLSPLPHAAAGLRHGGATGERPGHGAPRDQAAGASQCPWGWHLPSLHPAVLPPHHPAHAAGRLSCASPQPPARRHRDLCLPFPFPAPAVARQWDAGRIRPQLHPAGSRSSASSPSMASPSPWAWGAGEQGGSLVLNPCSPRSGLVMSLRDSSSCRQSASTGSWSEWAWGSGTGRGAASSAGVSHGIAPRLAAVVSVFAETWLSQSSCRQERPWRSWRTCTRACRNGRGTGGTACAGPAGTGRAATMMPLPSCCTPSPRST